MRMKKLISFLFLLLAAVSFGVAQTVVFSDNFDTYTAGSYLAQSNSAWTTWGGYPGTAEDGVITNAQAASLPNSLLISGVADQVYPFGNYTTGHYTVSFNMYIPSTGNGAYFNIQHVLLQQWAYECYFYNNGTGYLKVGGSDINFTYPSNTWFPVLMDVDLDNDLTSLSINNVVVNSWPFHYTGEATSGGANKLAGIDLYAGAPNDLAGTYYVDDFTVTEMSAALIGEFVVSPTTLSTTLAPNTTGALSIDFSNPGTNVTDYKIVTTYDIPNPDNTSTGEDILMYTNQVETPIGFTSAIQYDLAVGFPADMLQTHIGKTLRTIAIPLTSEVTNAKIRVWGMSNPLWAEGPGELLYEQTFTPTDDWNYINLSTPVVIDGSDLWIGVWIDQPDSIFPIFMDASSANDYSAWYRTGTTWHKKFTNYEYNLCIVGYIDGTPITPWLSVSPSTGTINAEGSQSPTVTFNSQGMALGETHTAKLHCYSTDFNNKEVVVPVSLSITNVEVDEHNRIAVSLYPNPTVDQVQISADRILRVEVFNLAGQKMMDNEYNDSHVVLDASHLTAGTYMVTVTTNTGKTTKKVIVR